MSELKDREQNKGEMGLTSLPFNRTRVPVGDKLTATEAASLREGFLKKLRGDLDIQGQLPMSSARKVRRSTRSHSTVLNEKLEQVKKKLEGLKKTKKDREAVPQKGGKGKSGFTIQQLYRHMVFKNEE